MCNLKQLFVAFKEKSPIIKVSFANSAPFVQNGMFFLVIQGPILLCLLNTPKYQTATCSTWWELQRTNETTCLQYRQNGLLKDIVWRCLLPGFTTGLGQPPIEGPWPDIGALGLHTLSKMSRNVSPWSRLGTALGTEGFTLLAPAAG